MKCAVAERFVPLAVASHYITAWQMEDQIFGARASHSSASIVLHRYFPADYE